MLFFFLLLIFFLLFHCNHVISPTFSSHPPLLLTSDYLYSDTVSSFKYRRQLEYQYRRQLHNTSTPQVGALSELYHRDVALQTRSRDLLPPAPPLFSPLCVRYLQLPSPPPATPVSVVISYHDELPVLLMRTLTVLVHRTPPSLLHEVVLVDDASSGDSLEREITAFSEAHDVRIRYFRSHSKMGITGARRKGVELSSGEVVAILDSHMEVSMMWVEPLLDVISNRPGAVAVPCIRMIFESNYSAALQPQYPHTVYLNFGLGTLCFDTTLPDDLPEYTHHYRSPGLAGGALLARRETLIRLYPRSSLSTGWGVENSRLAVRAWLCGDGVFMSCCSQVVHPNGNDPQLTRYFDKDSNLFNTLLLESTAEILNFIPDTAQREKWALRVVKDPEELFNKSRVMREEFNPVTEQCGSYAEYVDQVHPHSVFDLSDSVNVGQVQSVLHPWLCVEHFSKANSSGIMTSPCRKVLFIHDNQVIGINKNGAIRNSYNNCWSYNFTVGIAETKNCRAKRGTEELSDKLQIFAFRNGHVKHLSSTKCLALTEKYNKKVDKYPDLIFTKCDSGSDLQMWQVKAARWL